MCSASLYSLTFEKNDQHLNVRNQEASEAEANIYCCVHKAEYYICSL